MDVTYFKWLSITSVPNLYGEGLVYGSSAKRSLAKGMHLVFRSEIINNCLQLQEDGRSKDDITNNLGNFYSPNKKKNKRNMVAYEIFLRGLMFILEQN